MSWTWRHQAIIKMVIAGALSHSGSLGAPHGMNSISRVLKYMTWKNTATKNRENELKMPLFKEKEGKKQKILMYTQELDVRALTWCCNLKIKAVQSVCNGLMSAGACL